MVLARLIDLEGVTLKEWEVPDPPPPYLFMAHVKRLRMSMREDEIPLISGILETRFIRSFWLPESDGGPMMIYKQESI